MIFIKCHSISNTGITGIVGRYHIKLSYRYHPITHHTSHIHTWITHLKCF